jgi:hypothetical protein
MVDSFNEYYVGHCPFLRYSLVYSSHEFIRKSRERNHRVRVIGRTVFNPLVSSGNSIPPNLTFNNNALYPSSVFMYFVQLLFPLTTLTN